MLSVMVYMIIVLTVHPDTLDIKFSKLLFPLLFKEGKSLPPESSLCFKNGVSLFID